MISIWMSGILVKNMADVFVFLLWFKLYTFECVIYTDLPNIHVGVHEYVMQQSSYKTWNETPKQFGTSVITSCILSVYSAWSEY